MSENRFDWVPFYGAFAKKLLSYKNNHYELVKKVKSAFNEIGIGLPTLEHQDHDVVAEHLNRLYPGALVNPPSNGPQVFDIDPFTVMGLFNKSSMTLENRTQIIKELANQLDVVGTVPTHFDGIPTLNNQNAAFYKFIDERGSDDINNLWKLAECAINYAENPSDEGLKRLKKSFDLAIQKKGNGTGKITAALYWLAPDVFLNLDKTNRWLLYKSNVIPTDVVSRLPKIKGKITADQYFDAINVIQDYLKTEQALAHSLIELSAIAWENAKKAGKEAQDEIQKIEDEDFAESAEEVQDVAAVLENSEKLNCHYWIFFARKKSV